MTKTLAVALLLTWTPGYVLWLTVAGLALAAFGAWQEWQDWQARRAPLGARADWAAGWMAAPVPVRVEVRRARR